MRTATVWLIIAVLTGCDSMNWRHMGAQWAETLCDGARSCTVE